MRLNAKFDFGDRTILQNSIFSAKQNIFLTFCFPFSYSLGFEKNKSFILPTTAQFVLNNFFWFSFCFMSLIFKKKKFLFIFSNVVQFFLIIIIFLLILLSF